MAKRRSSAAKPINENPEPNLPVTTTPKAGLYERLGKLVHAVEHDPFVRIAAAAAAVFSLFVLWETSQQIRTDLADREQERIDKAIEKLQARSAGDTGRGTAFNFLFSKGWDISNYDQSCEAVGNWGRTQDVATGTPMSCLNRPVVRYLRLAPPELTWSDRFWSVWDNVRYQAGFREEPNESQRVIIGLKLTDVEIGVATVEDQYFLSINLDRAQVWASTFNNTMLDGSFRGTEFGGTDFANSEIAGDLTGAKFGRVVLEGVVHLRSTEGIKQFTAIAWSDHPPLTYKEFTAPVTAELASRTKLTADYPLPLDLLKQMTLCAPPTGSNGAPTPVKDRPDLRSFSGHCTKVSADIVFRDGVEKFRKLTGTN